MILLIILRFKKRRRNKEGETYEITGFSTSFGIGTSSTISTTLDTHSSGIFTLYILTPFGQDCNSVRR